MLNIDEKMPEEAKEPEEDKKKMKMPKKKNPEGMFAGKGNNKSTS